MVCYLKNLSNKIEEGPDRLLLSSTEKRKTCYAAPKMGEKNTPGFSLERLAAPKEILQALIVSYKLKPKQNTCSFISIKTC